ncbi:beta-phosphoglucomutase family hydrolase [Maribellus sp. YY47]|uniref:HAD family hydrolase n=1 Tax=Maribellus sp. YY47 TaxID=2929486 RepID=UPI00200109CD|nr:beta-phosphoglucomutase family hydrolase [Maribellus sp. YY47]MCK3682903.1 beta-phosphoglucomutase family hydrolase [Maribellus sp. YY47]
MDRKLDIHPNAKALIFDLDGTLADNMPIHYLAFRSVLKDYNVDLKPDFFMSLAGVPAVETIARYNEVFGVQMEPEKVGHQKEAEYETLMSKMKPVEPVVELLKKYHGKLPIAIGTGGYRRLAEKTLEIIGIEKYVDVLVSADDVQHPKPHPETFLKCAEQMGVAPEFCHVFEDGKPGMQAARTAGMMVTDVNEYYEMDFSIA